MTRLPARGQTPTGGMKNVVGRVSSRAARGTAHPSGSMPREPDELIARSVDRIELRSRRESRRRSASVSVPRLPYLPVRVTLLPGRDGTAGRRRHKGRIGDDAEDQAVQAEDEVVEGAG